MEAEKHLDDKKRLNQALNGKLDVISADIKNVLQEHSIDLMPEVAIDVFFYALEEIHLERFNPRMFVQ